MKLISILSQILPAGVVVFAISYIAGDVPTEVYCFHRVRLLIWLGCFCKLLTVFAIWLESTLRAALFWDVQGAYELMLNSVPRLLNASFLAYLIGKFAYHIVLAKTRLKPNGRRLWSRTLGSTLVGQRLDSIVVVNVAYLVSLSLTVKISAVAQRLIKSFYEALAGPFTYIAVDHLNRSRSRLVNR